MNNVGGVEMKHKALVYFESLDYDNEEFSTKVITDNYGLLRCDVEEGGIDFHNMYLNIPRKQGYYSIWYNVCMEQESWEMNTQYEVISDFDIVRNYFGVIIHLISFLKHKIFGGYNERTYLS